MTGTDKKETCLNLSGRSKFAMNKKLIFSLVLTLLLTTIGSSATLNVPGGYATIQAAITAAASGDIIEVADGTYTAAGFYNIDFGGKLVTVRNSSGDPTKCIIDCQNVSGRRGFYFHNYETPAATVEGITIKNANAGGLYYGGAIECEEASPTISNCIITNNSAAFGGAIDCFNASPVIKNCIITNNTATYDGGAIECSYDSNPQIINCLIANNTAGYYGGAIDIYDSSSPTITNCTIADNTGSGGFGGVYAASGSSSTIKNSILWNNGDDIYGPTTVTYSCIQDGDAGTGNINTDPMFRTGPLGNYYLSQISAGQLADSNCVNACTDSVDDIFGPASTFTTRTDNQADIEKVDMGFHYPDGGPAAQCKLIAEADPSDAGTVNPNHPSPGQDYKQFSEIVIQATPNSGNKLFQWIDANTATYNPADPGTYNTTSGINDTITITLNDDKTVIAEFSTVATYKLITYVIGDNGVISDVDPNDLPDPCDSRAYFIPQGNSATITAHPDAGYVVKQWLKGETATFDINNPDTYEVIPGALGNTYTTTIDANTTITVEFKYQEYLLTTSVYNGNGAISPKRGYYPAGTTVDLTAAPDDGYRVQAWGGDAANKPAWNITTNTVVMDGPKDVNVAFELGQNQLIHVFGDVNGIQEAIDIANNGDTIQIHPGTYTGVPSGFLVSKVITIVGDPENPENVVIDCETQGGTNLGFILSGQSVTLNGITITGVRSPLPIPYDNYGGAIYITGNHTVKNCIIRNALAEINPTTDGSAGGDPDDPNNPDANGGNGGDGGSAGGAGIYVHSGNPYIQNVLIEDCWAIGGNAGNGAPGYSDQNDYNSDDPNIIYYPPGIAGYGGDGGDAFGAGIYTEAGSPYFINVTVRNCGVRAGNGGNGADGSADANGGDGGLPGRAAGAGIYCAAGSASVFSNCVIENCIGYGGRGGNGGNAGQLQLEEHRTGGYGGLTTETAAGQGDIRMYSTNGGAVFCDDNSNPVFDDCTFRSNMTYGSISGVGGHHQPSNTQEMPRENYRMPSFGAGVFCSRNTASTFDNCLFENNKTAYNQDFNDPNYLAAVGLADINDYDGEYTGQGGGLCLWYAASADIIDCNFSQNSAPIGGGIYSLWTDLYITKSNILNNDSLSGGGILALDSVVEIIESSIKGNSAGTQTGTVENTGYALFGSGGGVYALSSLIDINDTVVTENYARLTGGGICLDGDTIFAQKPLIKNCLITANTAADSGGGIASTYFARPTIQNCTLADNLATGVNGRGGGLFGSYESDTIAKDSIFWDNSGINGSQIALSDGGLFTDMPASLTISYSDIDLRLVFALDSITSSSGGSGSTSALMIIDEQTIYNEINSSGSATVIVSLDEPVEAQTTDWSSPDSVSDLQNKIATLQDQTLSIFTPDEFTLRHKLTNVAVFSGKVTNSGLSKLLDDPTVAHIEPVRTVRPMLAQAIPLANALTTRPTYNGQEVSIAIVDTGVDYTHPRLGGGTFPNSKIIGGYDTGNNDADPIPAGEAHGTACAGIAAGLLGTVGDYIGGVAYDAKIYALKASFDNTDNFYNDATLAAWDWCITHRNDNPENPIRVMSNSWGLYDYPIDNEAEADVLSPAHTIAAQTAVNAGITILAASGNDGFAGDGISWPAAMSNIISVGAVYDTTDMVAEYSNTANILDILAPADPVYTTDIVGSAGYSTGDYYPYFNGTSSACPFAAGAVAALQSAAKQITGDYLTPVQVKSLLASSGDPVTDTKVTITKPRVNLGTAITLLNQMVPVHTERNCTIIGIQKDVNDMWTVAGGSNISEDPNFIPGIGYYLSHTDTMQVYTSPCFDIGSTPAVNLGLDTYTTRVDGFKDTGGDVDLGYHYLQGIATRYQLTVEISDSGGGTIKSPWLAGYTYNIYAGQIITFEAVPDANYKVVNWFIDDVGQQTNNNNFTTIMDRNRKVSVSFEPVTDETYQPIKLYVPTQYPDLGSAIDAAQNGDQIILDTGTYSWNDSNFDYTTIYINGKNITIRGTAPDDPCVVAQTVILGNGFSIFNVDRTMTIEGITFQDAHYYAGNVDCGVEWAHSEGGDGYNGYSIFGGAMRLYNASPTIRNCRFVNCSATASDGCNGNDTGDGGWAGWAYGGAIAINSFSNPLIKNCDFIDCYAQSGNGGDGGTGNPNGHGGNWGDNTSSRWDFGPYQPYWYYSGKGGAIYCGSGSKPVIENCFFSGNNTYSGTSGLSNIDGWPNYHYAIPAFGGAVYIARGSETKITNCIFSDNEADTRGQIGDPNTTDDFVLYSPMVSYGGAICIENTSVEEAEDTIGLIENSTFFNNRACAGGGIYQKEATAHIIDSTFESCTAMTGGAMAMISNKSAVVDCDFRNNSAIQPSGKGGAIYSESDTMFYDCLIAANNAAVAGGGAYFTGDFEPNMHNCLITNNNANRDGAGISANWNTELTISNCTLANNTILGTGFATGYGGGLSCAYEAYVKVNNSIMWNNNAEYGSEIAIGNMFEAADKYGAQVDVSYSDIKDGQAGIFADTENGCILNWDAGNFNGTSLESPLFVIGPWGNFYLSQTATPDANQTVDSPCVDAGFGSAIDNSMYKHTTRTDHIIDVTDSNVDMGYHYTLVADLLGDFNFDGIVTFEDFGLFILFWLDDGCTFPYYCAGRDLNKDGRVDFEDFALFAENYGKTETIPPRPNPMTWALSPRSADSNSITMTATTAIDNSSPIIEYYFECTSGGGNNRGWNTDTSYTDTGLTHGQLYGYRVKARDAKHNETGWSVIGYAVPGDDSTPPEPNPMTWATAPYATSSSSIRMIASTATDISDVEYYFEETSGNPDGTTSGWQDSPIYEDFGLSPSTEYSYRVKARDKSPAQNQTGYSDIASAMTDDDDGTEPTEDTVPPEPNPSQWESTPLAYYDGQFYYHTMTAIEATDDSLPVYYYFECTDGAGTSSNWQTDPTYTAGPYLVENYSVYRVWTKDALGNTGSPSPKYDTNGQLVP